MESTGTEAPSLPRATPAPILAPTLDQKLAGEAGPPPLEPAEQAEILKELRAGYERDFQKVRATLRVALRLGDQQWIGQLREKAEFDDRAMAACDAELAEIEDTSP